MEKDAVTELAEKIAKKLQNIKSAEQQKLVLQKKLDTLLEETSCVKESLNKIDELIASNKYEITYKLSETNKLVLIENGD
jgi:hypothetical protein